ncbi:MAG: ROK family protein [Erysipelotrichaceae bacterium]|nr:ROK family protein [Erysipelotrichaceae bacterium]
MKSYVPSLEKDFRPMIIELRKFKEKGTVPFAICVERQSGYKYRYDLNVLPGKNAENEEMIERVIKSILWIVGGFKIYLGGNDELVKAMQEVFSYNGSRKFDVEFMERVYKQKFEVVACSYENVPASVEASIPAGGHLEGNRIGFDAGGSDRKVSAVVNGEVIHSEEVVWFPKINEDPEYHYQGILDSFRRAAEKMPSVDAIGVSSAGIYIDNEVRVASLFIKVPQDEFDAKVVDMYIRAAKQYGDVPLTVANDGDVTALAGSMSLKSGQVLGIAMGTSEAAGYVNKDGNLNGWLSELAFVPVDYNKGAMVDEWSGDYGCGVKYFSQDGVIKLAGFAGIELDENASPAEKLKVVQGLMKEHDPRAKEIYENIGTYLGYSIAYYSEFYDIKYLLLLGRVTSGEGGDILIEKANEVLKNVFPEYKDIKIVTPDEWTRRVGQSIAAASLPASK